MKQPRKRRTKTTEKTAIPRRETIQETHQPRLKNIYTTRLVISADRTPSGTRYDVEPGGIVTVDAADVEYLLSLKRKQGGCCGGAAPGDISYFMEV